MKLLLLWVVLIPIVSFLKFIVTDLLDSLVPKPRLQKKSVTSYDNQYTYKKAQ